MHTHAGLALTIALLCGAMIFLCSCKASREVVQEPEPEQTTETATQTPSPGGDASKAPDPQPEPPSPSDTRTDVEYFMDNSYAVYE